MPRWATTRPLPIIGRVIADRARAHTPATSHPQRPLTLYGHMASRAATPVIAEYSTSFSLATRMLDRATRADIRNLYAMVRIADEIVDGTAADAGLAPDAIASCLDDFERDTYAAMDTGFSANPVLHAFGTTARRCHLNKEHVRAFFHSMRQDLTTSQHTDTSLDDYIYGSAEVIGLMCLDIFTARQPLDAAAKQRATDGARHLGAAFQKINFLRDLAEDSDELGRAYLPGADNLTEFTNADKDRIVADIDADLAAAYPTIGYLPAACRVGVLTAYYLFEELTRIVDATDARLLATTRVHVHGAKKAQLAARAATTAWQLSPESSPPIPRRRE